MVGTEEAYQWTLPSNIKDMTLHNIMIAVNNRLSINNMEKSDETEYNCLAGDFMFNIASKATVVKLTD